MTEQAAMAQFKALMTPMEEEGEGEEGKGKGKGQGEGKVRPIGPTAKENAAGRAYVHCEVRQGGCVVSSGSLRCPAPYHTTVLSICFVLGEITEGRFKTGFFTPGMAYPAQDWLNHCGMAMKMDAEPQSVGREGRRDSSDE